MTSRLPRRFALSLAAALPGLALLPAAPRPARAAAFPGAACLAVLMSDLHSAQERAAATLGALDRVLAANAGTPALVVVNGDVFERGNAIALRSMGAADWAFLSALRRRAPVVLNLGNHETALLDDMAETVARARALDLAVVSNLQRAADGAPLADAAFRLDLPGGRRLVVVGIATDEAATYRQVARERLRFPEPAAWARANLPALAEGAEFVLVASHAGVAADRAILPLLPEGALLFGGHEHLRFVHAAGGRRYLHTGSWNRFFTVAAFGEGGIRSAEVAVEPGIEEDPAHAALWREVFAAHARPEDQEVLFRLPAALPLPAAARRAVAAVAAAAGVEVGLMNHTTFGTGLPAGEVTRLAFDAFLRFDGGLVQAEADAAAIAAIAARANQDEEVPLERRIGDFVYASALPAGPARLAANGWVGLNAARYLGSALAFRPVPELRVKAVVQRALSAG
ncbi:MAG: metallophosphoesterase [Acetobacteraceae bacterium]|nr:metallophosphoesterase [Acetobacteraceae bacterium]